MAVESVEINNLRGIRAGVVDRLSPLSVLVGPNNSGKSTVLEALYCAAAAASARNVFETLLRRGGPPKNALERVVTAQAQAASIIVSGGGVDRIEAALRLVPVLTREQGQDASRAGLKEPFWFAASRWHFDWSGWQSSGECLTAVDHQRTFASNFVSGKLSFPFAVGLVDVDAMRKSGALEDAYSILERQRRVEDVMAALKRAMPKLTDLRILKIDDDFVLHAISGDETPLPAYLAGDGFKRILEIAAAVYDKENGLVLLEEPESFQHPRYLAELATLLRDASRRGTQVVLSTHSLELIDLLLAIDDIQATVHRFRLDAGELRSVAVSAQDARAARQALEQDLRA